jgi:hypothetical protein
MSDDFHGRHHGILDRLDTLARYRHIERRLERQKRRRWSRRLFALSGILLLVGGLSMCVQGNYSQRQVTARVLGTRMEVDMKIRTRLPVGLNRPVNLVDGRTNAALDPKPVNH